VPPPIRGCVRSRSCMQSKAVTNFGINH